VEPALWTAVSHGKTDEVRRLLSDEGGDIEERGGPTGCSPLSVAAVFGQEAVALLLLEHGADVSALSNEEETPLHIAAREGREAFCLLLLEHRADLSAKTKDGWTPLHIAARHGRCAAARLLLNKGADVHSPAGDGRTPEDIAIRFSHMDIAEMIHSQAQAQAQALAEAQAQAQDQVQAQAPADQLRVLSPLLPPMTPGALAHKECSWRLDFEPAAHVYTIRNLKPVSLTPPVSAITVRETKILVEQQPPQGVLVCDHAGLVINKFSQEEEEAPRACISVTTKLAALGINAFDADAIIRKNFAGWQRSVSSHPRTFLFFFFTLVTGPRRSLSLKLRDTRATLWVPIKIPR